MLTVWGRKTSSNVQALMWCIAELGLAYVRHDVGQKYGGNDTLSFAAPTSPSPTSSSAISSIATSTSPSTARPAYRQHVMVSYEELRVV